ncbi:DUF4198 domain-containing protein [Gayadomonas joobiniege]|uniref:DUF4198 domain-containing protein n=1 Tax=Gayadomonas joobiniege TaxID=1234606 RepID=UPI00036BE3A0|nr:DUF4198 domain-containing protein [Gayadomonas joobiniege]
MKLRTILTTTALALSLVSTAQAHRAWVKPSTTLSSGDTEWVTFDAAVANTIFFADHFPYPVQRLTAWDPNKKEVELKNVQKLKYRSVFDLELTEQGTYKVFTAANSLRASWKDADGERQRWPGRGEIGTAEDFYKKVPQDANELSVSQNAYRLEVYTSLQAPSAAVLKPTGSGLELNGKTHPNDLYTSEPITLGFLMDGKPAEGTEVTLVKDGEKYRDESGARKFTTNKQGEINFEFDEPGLYWLEAEYEDDKAQAPATSRRGSYTLVVEVLSL